MKETISLAIDLHVFFISAMLFFAVFNFFLIKNSQDYGILAKKIQKYELLYYLFLSLAFFTGFVVIGAMKLQFSVDVYLMIISAIAIIILGVKNHKFFKKTNIKNIKSQEEYKSFAKKKYMIDLSLIVLISCISFVV